MTGQDDKPPTLDYETPEDDRPHWEGIETLPVLSYATPPFRRHRTGLEVAALTVCAIFLLVPILGLGFAVLSWLLTSH